jgi:pimeloyl-ACP methyl ester carboxylesterase
MSGTPQEPREHRVAANGLEHRVLVWNERGGPTVVLCHGYLDHAYSFDGVARALAASGLRAVAFDWRGHGGTDRVGPGGYYHFADYVLDLHALMPALTSRPQGEAPRGERSEVHLVGHSMGGTAAALYAATHPGTLRTLTLVEGLGPPAFTGDPVDKMMSWLESVDRHRSHHGGSTSAAIESAATVSAATVPGERPAPRHPEAGRTKPMRDVAEAMRRLGVQHGDLPESLARFLAEKGTVEAPGGGLLWRFDPLHRTTAPIPFSVEAFSAFLARIDAPTLLVRGSRGFRTEDHAARVAALRSARELVIEDVGHMIHWLEPARLAAAIAAHVREHGSAAQGSAEREAG